MCQITFLLSNYKPECQLKSVFVVKDKWREDPNGLRRENEQNSLWRLNIFETHVMPMNEPMLLRGETPFLELLTRWLVV